MTKGNIAWVVPPIQEGSGGLRTIFQNLNYAAKSGYRNDIYFEDSGTNSIDKIKNDLKKYYGEILADNIYLGTEIKNEYDLAIATGWHTAETVRLIECPHKAYFIQDYEPWFFPVSTDYFIAKQSYQFGFSSITIGRWLAKYIQDESKQNASFFDFCADLSIYHHDQTTQENAICCIYQPEKNRRCADLLLMALRVIKIGHPELTIYLYGSNTEADVDFEVINLGIISPEECNKLYNKCLLGVSISSTNPSRIPFEMMASGLPVVDLYLENNLYDLPDEAVLLADPNSNALVTAIAKLLEDDIRRGHMSQAGINFMQDRPLEKGYQQFIAALDSIFSNQDFRHKSPKLTYKRATIKDPSQEKPNSTGSVSAPHRNKSTLSHIRRRAGFVMHMFHPRNITKAYQILKKGGVKDFRRRLKSRLHYQYAEQRYQYRDYLRITRPTARELEQQRKAQFDYRPCFGVMIPLYNTKPEYLRDLLDGFKRQTYNRFKLFMVDASPAKDGKTALTDYMQSEMKCDPRIIYKILEKNEGIAGNTNQAIQLAMQDPEVTHIALCDHDDFIEPDALYQYTKVLNQDKNIKIIYSDEDVVKFKDDPEAYYVMKPDFNPYHMESCNYINHFFVCEKGLLEKIKTEDGLYEQPKYDGAQDYDLYLRLMEEASKLDEDLKEHETKKIGNAAYTSSTIYHIPKVLYHWRAAENSTAQDPHNKMYAFDAGKRALEDYFKRRKINIKSVEHTDVLGTYRIKYNLQKEPLVSIIIPNKDHVADLKTAIESVRKGTYQNLEFIIIENNSTEPETFAYYDKIKNDKSIKIVYFEGEYNYSAINNFGVKSARGDILLLLNNDIKMIDPDSISEMVAILERKEVGVVGAQLLFPDGELQHAGVVTGLGGSAGHIFHHIRPEFSYGNRANCVVNYSAVTAACLMVKKSTYEKVNGFDENFAVAFNDVDFCLKIRALGELVVYTPYAKFYHYESKSRGADTSGSKLVRMEQEAEKLRNKWPELYLNGDPYYNKNFTLHRSDCSLREIRPSDFR